MKTRYILISLAIITVMLMCFGLSACGKSNTMSVKGVD